MKTKLLCFALATGLSTGAWAAPYLNGSLSIGDTSGAIVHAPANQMIDQATSVTFSDATAPFGKGDLQVNSTSVASSFATLGVVTNDAVNWDINSWSFGASGIANPLIDLFSSAHGNTLEFFSTSAVKSITASTTPSYGIQIQGLGYWHDTSGAFADTAGAYTVSFTQTSLVDDPNSAISFSGTFAAFQAPAQIPEPGTALLAGLGILGATRFRRKQ